jgi:hypothetical protein
MRNLLDQQSYLQSASKWFLQSGIQEESGGVARYYRTDSGVNARISTEITGYAISALAYLYRRTGESECLQAARKAAGFLTERAWIADHQIMPFEFPKTDAAEPPHAYFFDSGIIVRGLLALHRIDRDPRLLRAAVNCGTSMKRDFLNGDAIHPILVLPDKTPLTYAPSWSRSPGCYQLKSAMAWDDLAAATGDESLRICYDNALESALRTHTGFLSAASDKQNLMDRLHAYCYFLEALLPRLHLESCRQAMHGGLEEVSRMLREIRPDFERSDVCAQLLRLRLFAAHAGAAELDTNVAEEEAQWCASYAASASDPRIDRGFWFGRKGGEMLPFVNPVSTSFAMQALDMWQLFTAGKFEGDRHELI